jgi:hypothetical protein
LFNLHTAAAVMVATHHIPQVGNLRLQGASSIA